MLEIPIKYARMTCLKCSVMFIIPDDLYVVRQTLNRPVHCPGCCCKLFPIKPLKPLEERQDEILRIHEEEQAEARESDRRRVRRKPTA